MKVSGYIAELSWRAFPISLDQIAKKIYIIQINSQALKVNWGYSAIFYIFKFGKSEH